jgi:hypothetical protein
MAISTAVLILNMPTSSLTVFATRMFRLGHMTKKNKVSKRDMLLLVGNDAGAVGC